MFSCKSLNLKELVKSFIVPWVILYLLFGLDQLVLRRLFFPNNAKDIVYFVVQPGCYASLFVALKVLLGKYRWILLPVYIYIFIIEILELALSLMFGVYFLGDLLLIVLNSSREEVVSVAGSLLSIRHILLIFVTSSIGGLSAWIVFRRHVYLKACPRLVVFAMLCMPFVLLDVCWLPVDLISRQTLCTYFLSDTVTMYDSNSELAKACKDPLPYGNVSISASEKGLLGVLVIGESMTRNNMSLYGYKRDTTPRMKSLAGDNLYVYEDVLTSWGGTQKALIHFLTEKELNGRPDTLCVFPEVCRRAGYHCVLFSNQRHWGGFDSLDAMMFSMCHETNWMEERKTEHPIYDVDMVKMLAETVAERRDEPMMAFLHLAGSHYPCQNYDADSAPFSEELKDSYTEHLSETHRRLYNRYDNTIEMTDRTFSRIVELVKNTHRPGFVMLISDHGESPRKEGMRIATDRDVWEIPMVVWVSDEYKKLFPEVVRCLRESVAKKLQQDQLFVGMLSLSRISGYLRYDEHRDFLSPDFIPRVHRWVCNGTVVYEKDAR